MVFSLKQAAPFKCDYRYALSYHQHITCAVPNKEQKIA